MKQLDRAGIFKAMPTQWSVRTSDDTQSVAVAIEFKITAQLNGSVWDSWADYEDHMVWGHFYVIKKDGELNQTAIDQLAQSLGWMGELDEITKELPPQEEVQITVKEEEYQGKVRIKATWMNPGDFVPQASGASSEDVRKLQTRFGSLLRAAAATARKAVEEKLPFE